MCVCVCVCEFVKSVNMLDVKDLSLFRFLKHEHVPMSPSICHMLCSVYMS